MKRTFAAAAALAGALFAASARAQTTVYLFTTVDAVAVYGNRLTITGILQGTPAPVDVPVDFSSYQGAFEGCHRAALLAMEKPGLYQLELKAGFTTAPCKLIRVNP
jgi:hypothetical protein